MDVSDGELVVKVKSDVVKNNIAWEAKILGPWIKVNWVNIDISGISELKWKDGSLIVVQEKALESPLDCKKIKPVNPKRNQPWIFTGRTDAEAEAPTLWPPDAKSQLTGKDPHAGKDWRQKEKEVAKDEMVG